MTDQEIIARCAARLGLSDEAFDPINNEDDLCKLIAAFQGDVDLSVLWEQAQGETEAARKAAFHRAAAEAFAAAGA